jgi:hypothetical protein
MFVNGLFLLEGDADSLFIASAKSVEAWLGGKDGDDKGSPG